MYKAKQKAGLILKNSYGYLPSLIGLINEAGNIGKLVSENNVFERFFMTWAAAKDFYRINRKLVYFDGTFLAGPNKGTLLTAVAQDGNESLVLLAFSIVESENSSSWNWFIENINNEFNLNTDETVIISDREKGILQAVSNILPCAKKSNCARHIAKNLKSQFRNKRLFDLFWTSVNTYSQANFLNLMNQIKVIDLDFYIRLEVIGFETWSNAFFPIPRYGKTTSNAVESMNAALKKFVELDITNLIVSINNYSMKIFNSRRLLEIKDSILPNVSKSLIKSVAQGKLFNIAQSSENILLIDQNFTVKIADKNCNCGLTKDKGIPCSHLCAANHFLKTDITDFISPYFYSTTYNQSYLTNINPLSSLTLITSPLQPPTERRSRGRPKIKRIRSYLEN